MAMNSKVILYYQETELKLIEEKQHTASKDYRVEKRATKTLRENVQWSE